MAEVIGKIAANTFRPKRILGQAEEVREMVLGTLIGQANGFKTGKAKSPTGEEFTYKGYTGRFEYQDAHPDANGELAVIQSGVLYLPAGIDEMLGAAVKAAEEVNGHVNIALGVKVYRSGVPGGYSWKFDQLAALEANDPLDELRAAISGKSTGPLLTSADAGETLAIGNASGAETVDPEAPDAEEVAETVETPASGKRR